MAAMQPVVLRICVPAWQILLVPAGDFDHAPAFADVVADRLFDIDVLAGLHGPDGGQGVPVVRRGDADERECSCCP